MAYTTGAKQIAGTAHITPTASCWSAAALTALAAAPLRAGKTVVAADMPDMYAMTQTVHIATAAIAARTGRGSGGREAGVPVSSNQIPQPAAASVTISPTVRTG